MKTSRRNFIKKLAYAGGLMQFPTLLPQSFAQTTYAGKLVITVQFLGAWDVSSFCDPKENVTGELEINHWARSDETRQAGNIPYAPYGRNETFFEKHYPKMLVINGIDAQTNAHETGEIHSWSGRTAAGYPSITALTAAVKAPELPLAYLSFGGFGNTEGLIRSTRIDTPGNIRNIIFPNRSPYNADFLNHTESDWDRIRAAQLQSLNMLAGEPGIAARDQLNRQYYLDTFSKAEQIQAFGDLIPSNDQIQQIRQPLPNFGSALHQQVQMALLAFKAGVSISADLWDGGFDTHAFHDRDHEPLLANSIDAVDYLWDYAEELGLADRLLVILGSDFSRTPYYNSGEGKDHWPIGSHIIMEKNVGFTNKVIGETDEGQNAYRYDATTLQRDDSTGTIMYPKHIHKALRKYIGIEDDPIVKRFPFNNTEDFDFFS